MLSLLIGIPLLGGLLVGLIPEQAGKGLHRSLALGFGLAWLGLSLGLLLQFDPQAQGIQMAEQMAWIPQLGLVYELVGSRCRGGSRNQAEGGRGLYGSH